MRQCPANGLVRPRMAAGVSAHARRAQWAAMLDQADQLLYQAKDAGRGRCQVQSMAATDKAEITPAPSSTPRAKTARA